jgi:hypothetical protein
MFFKSPLAILFLALPLVPSAQALTELECERFTILDHARFKLEHGVLTERGFRASDVSPALAFSPQIGTYEQVVAIQGKPVLTMPFWMLFSVNNGMTNFERSANVYDSGIQSYVMMRYAAGANGTTTFTELPEEHTNGLVNTSVRAVVPAGRPVILGFYLTSRTTVLIRAGGPALAAFGVSGTLQNPTLRVFSGADVIGANDDWDHQTHSDGYMTLDEEITIATAKCGATPYAAGSKDAAMMRTLEPGAYSAFAEAPAGSNASGEIIFEVYQVPN